jgi:ribonuclease VapC
MVIDTSAIVAVVARESDGPRFAAVLEEERNFVMSAFTVFECRTVLARKFPSALLGDFEQLLHDLPIAVHAFDKPQADRAFMAYRRFGKGSGHPAQLNLGDCAAYALATSQGLPLLFKGNDFPHTDVRPALA